MGNDEACRGDNSRHPAASWLAHGGGGSPQARESPIAEAAHAGSVAVLVLGTSVPQCQVISVKAVTCRINSVDHARYSCVTLKFGSGACGELSTGSSRQLVELTKLSQLDSLEAESTSSRTRTARNAELILVYLVSNVESPVGITKELTASVPLAMKTRSRSIGDEDKERMTMVLAIVPPDGRPVLLAPRVLSCGDRLLMWRYKPSKPRSHTKRSGQEPYTPGGTKCA